MRPPRSFSIERMYIGRCLFDYHYRRTGFGSALNGRTVEFQFLRQDGEGWIRCCVRRELTLYTAFSAAAQSSNWTRVFVGGSHQNIKRLGCLCRYTQRPNNASMFELADSASWNLLPRKKLRGRGEGKKESHLRSINMTNTTVGKLPARQTDSHSRKRLCPK
ncbi:hypothetical protein BDV32DRAFT_36073 [Aspergillus pseudonomiae]|uniref:Uncharacterized protein n=1 Tax=Aspergillus pseudonomiae TaxID=1506151 RepID=A0A5N6II09_9EURO|nr:uncharacterized protein BDV37DRAFT_7268 [Aspergillus pseudonomiae]KAB8265844.1 hypothetical protein BDV32DRAFT_36073 [Aspergillus pseudonomiae]KAE8399269.1 hypothetical protein BDV37DRAFT_7268 [Aspergillus pseudonomiae]